MNPRQLELSSAQRRGTAPFAVVVLVSTLTCFGGQTAVAASLRSRARQRAADLHSKLEVGLTRQHTRAVDALRLDRNLSGLLTGYATIRLGMALVLPEWYYQAAAALGTLKLFWQAGSLTAKTGAGAALWGLARTTGDYYTLSRPEGPLRGTPPAGTTVESRTQAEQWLAEVGALSGWHEAWSTQLHRFAPFFGNVGMTADKGQRPPIEHGQRSTLRALFRRSESRRAAKKLAQQWRSGASQQGTASVANEHDARREKTLHTEQDIVSSMRFAGSLLVGLQGLRVAGLTLFWMAPFQWYFTYFMVRRAVVATAFATLAVRRHLQQRARSDAATLVAAKQQGLDVEDDLLAWARQQLAGPRAWSERATTAYAGIMSSSWSEQQDIERRLGAGISQLTQWTPMDWIRTIFDFQSGEGGINAAHRRKSARGKDKAPVTTLSSGRTRPRPNSDPDPDQAPVVP